MKVDIKHEDFVVKEGFFKKTTYPRVVLSVVFSEEELALIENNDLGNTLVLEREVPPNFPANDPNPDRWHLLISHLVKEPNGYTLATSLDAKNYEAHLKEALKELKTFIMANEAVENKDTSFEL